MEIEPWILGPDLISVHTLNFIITMWLKHSVSHAKERLERFYKYNWGRNNDLGIAQTCPDYQSHD